MGSWRVAVFCSKALSRHQAAGGGAGGRRQRPQLQPGGIAAQQGGTVRIAAGDNDAWLTVAPTCRN